MNQSIEAQLREEGFYVSTTVGSSMRPMLRNRRDRVIIKPVGTERLKPMDVPLYRRPDGKYVLHRILEVKADSYIIRGDNTFALENVPNEWVIGVMTEFYRKKKHVAADNKAYLRYARFWHAIYPVRYQLYRIRRFAAKIKHRLFQ